MAGMKTILALAFLLACGILSVILSCALDSNWLPLVSVLLFLLAPLPNAVCKRAAGSSDFMSEDNSGLLDTGYFMTAFFVVSGLALPVVLNHSGAITSLALILSLCGGSLIYLTVLGYMQYFVDTNTDQF
ncbi:Vacuolar protein sorting-associated protein 55 [Polyrhizophydium stewartii]|uniref:Vacuolar protein sorting-associated protein 55 n=1 Tax=Polyrhizophydium stewartii TaxID=2732419 RepID=A0ABR4NHE8_9FUNG|nr:Vacuolar protein sorting-associated protein 55 [Polyrhizophydium stewartii]